MAKAFGFSSPPGVPLSKCSMWTRLQPDVQTRVCGFSRGVEEGGEVGFKL